MYQHLQAFFMTGTGNSYKVAQWSAQAAAEKGVAGELVQVRTGAPCPTIRAQSLSVFTFPTHGFTAPWLMMKYALSLPRGEGRHAVVLPTRAGIRIKGLFIPGLEGTAGYLIALLLRLKGYSVRGVLGIDMPSNWTALHWGLSADNAAVICNLAESKVRGFMATALAGHRHYDGLVQLALGLLLAQISIMYLILGQLLLSKFFFASDRCTGCSLCRTVCPKQALRLAGRPPRPYWTYACDSCMACMNCCPQRAIEVSPLVVTLFYYLTTVPILAYALAFAAGRWGFDLAALPLAGFAVRYAYTLLAVALAYSLIHFAFGSRLLRAIAARLSLTRYFRRYAAPGVSLQEIHKKTN